MTDQPDAPDPAEPTSEMLGALYAQLRELAHARLRSERAGGTLRSTELVHEAYLRLAGEGPKLWASRAQFFAAAAEAMRRILIERARARGREKRGGIEGRPREKVSLSDLAAADLAVDYDLDQILALDGALQRLHTVDERGATVVRLRFYAGLSVDEVADVLGVTARTVKRDWTFARAWLFGALGESAAG
ncbi:MAG: ECF-type sigma factor [Candidatus Eiseniibacteriota bacterium]